MTESPSTSSVFITGRGAGGGIESAGGLRRVARVAEFDSANQMRLPGQTGSEVEPADHDTDGATGQEEVPADPASRPGRQRCAVSVGDTVHRVQPPSDAECDGCAEDEQRDVDPVAVGRGAGLGNG